MPRRRTSVATLVIVTIVTVATILLVTLGALNYWQERDRQLSALSSDTRTAADQLSAALALPLWNFDKAQVDKVLDSMMTNSDIHAVVVRQHDINAPGGIAIHARVRGSQWKGEATEKELASAGGDLLSEERPVIASDENMGSVKVFANAAQVTESLRRALYSVVLRIVLLDLLLIVSLSLLLWRGVIRPLRIVEKYAIAVSSGDATDADRESVRDRHFHGELESLRASIEKTVGDLKRQESMLEERVRQRTTELESANKELEAFSYSVSHDLRAPLRAISGFSRIVIEDHLAQMPDEAARYLNVIDQNARQMGHLIDDLLTFSRLSRQALQTTEVNLTRMAADIVAQLRAAEPAERKIAITIGELPPCQADPSLVRQVLTNLVSNALKYSRKREDAKIEIGYRAEPGKKYGAYFVKDNGAGFDMKYVGKLFGVFQRLHTLAEYEGTGVGLAIVKRIVERHGGRAWAEGAPDQGATFYFALSGERQ